jgi:hypothetical protein
MSKRASLILFTVLMSLLLVSSPLFAQEKSRLKTSSKTGSVSFGIKKADSTRAQPILAEKVKSELKKNLDKRQLRKLENAKTQKELVELLKVEAKRCNECTTTRKLVGKLSVGSNPDKSESVSSFWGETTDENGCGWAHCLTYWGEHIPCQGMPGDEEVEDEGPEGGDDDDEPAETEGEEG